MLGNVTDVEDILQETFIRWHQTPYEDIRSERALLVTIVSRLCINYLESARVQREEYVGQWLPEPVSTDPESDPLASLMVDESISMAFLLLLERLTPIERAVFLLREVFKYTYTEISTAVDQTEANCRQIFRRARQHVSTERQRFKTTVSDHSNMLDLFIRTTRSGDIDGLLELLCSNVTLHSDGGGKARAIPNLISGAETVARLLVGVQRKLVPQEIVSRIMEINGAPGFVGYLNGKPYSVFTLEIEQERIRAIYVVTNPDKLSHLPELPVPG